MILALTPQRPPVLRRLPSVLCFLLAALSVLVASGRAGQEEMSSAPILKNIALGKSYAFVFKNVRKIYVF